MFCKPKRLGEGGLAVFIQTKQWIPIPDRQTVDHAVAGMGAKDTMLIDECLYHPFLSF